LFPSQAEQETVFEILRRVGVEEKLFAKTDHLSGGQQQRVAIARALYQQPEAILADEPVASVDPARARSTMALLTQLAKEKDLTLGVSLHDRELAQGFLPRLIGVRGGRIFKDAPSEAWTVEDFDALYALERDPLHEKPA
jgi:phosphonate transport system ATP-binding protein